MTPGSRLQLPLALVHSALLLAIAALPITHGFSGASTLVAVLASVPLVAAMPGLLRARRYTYQWLTIVMVAFVGAAAVEVVASSTRASVGSAVLLLSLLELAALLALIRRPPAAGE